MTGSTAFRFQLTPNFYASSDPSTLKVLDPVAFHHENTLKNGSGARFGWEFGGDRVALLHGADLEWCG
jgi:hypothetical protein